MEKEGNRKKELKMSDKKWFSEWMFKFVWNTNFMETLKYHSLGNVARTGGVMLSNISEKSSNYNI